MTRKYRKRLRADLEEQTRQRIVRALVELHGSIGPARTTVRAVAAQAGVQRATVYRHFPDEPSMFAACSAHWAQENPPPDPAEWAGLDASERTRRALREVYGFYARNEGMLSNVFRDESLVKHLRPALQMFRDYLKAVGDGLASPDRSTCARAAIGHALSFTTWRSLIRENGISVDHAVALMTSMIGSAT